MKTKTKLNEVMAGAIKPIRKVTVSEWADRYYQLPSDSAEPGQYRSERTPYARAIMDAFTDESIHRVVVKSAAQVAKTTIILAVIGRYVHLDPCAIMMIQPTLEMAQDISKTRLSQMIEESKVLTPLFYDLGKSRNVNQTILSKFFKGGRLVLTQ